MDAVSPARFPYAHPDPVGEHPELPPGIEPRAGRPRWRPWTAVLGLVTGFAGAIAGAIVIGLVAAIFGADFADPPPAVTILGTIAQDASLIGAALLFAKMAERPLPEHFGLRRTRLWPAVGWSLVAWFGFYAFTAAFISVFGLDPAEDSLPQELGVDDSTVALVAVAVLVAVVAPVAEEFFFRGFFFGALRNWRGIWPAAVITGVVFGAIHAGSSDPAYLLPLAAFGFALCLLYVRTGSLYPCIGLHCANNSVAFGVSQEWTWGIPVLFVASMATITLAMLAIERFWTSAARRRASGTPAFG
jgi:membrane protease YdiL (CAAX protease family)